MGSISNSWPPIQRKMSIFNDNFDIEEIPDFDILETAATMEAGKRLVTEGEFDGSINDVLEKSLGKEAYSKIVASGGILESDLGDLRNAIQIPSVGHISRSPKCLKGDCATMSTDCSNIAPDYTLVSDKGHSRDSTNGNGEIPCQTMFDKQGSKENDSREMECTIESIEKFQDRRKNQ